jgi:hypothetical protein
MKKGKGEYGKTTRLHTNSGVHIFHMGYMGCGHHRNTGNACKIKKTQIWKKSSCFYCRIGYNEFNEKEKKYYE